MNHQPNPAESIDPLEAELSAMRPRELSPEFTNRLACRLRGSLPVSEKPTTTRRKRSLGWQTLATVAASLLLAVGLLTTGLLRERPTLPEPVSALPASEPDGASAQTPRFPSLLVYRSAMADPRRSLDQLLDEHANTLLPAVESTADLHAGMP